MKLASGKATYPTPPHNGPESVAIAKRDPSVHPDAAWDAIGCKASDLLAKARDHLNWAQPRAFAAIDRILSTSEDGGAS
jgi:hypothetical protein